MSLEYGIKQPLRFYENLEHQNRFRKGGDVKVFKLITPTDYLLPFQIKRAAGVLPISSIKYISIKDGSEIEVLGNLSSGEVETFNFQNFDYLVHYGSVAHTATIPTGEYYLEVTDTVTTWYSEVLDVRTFDPLDLSVSDCALTKITYWDECDVADTFYRTLQYGGVGNKQYKSIVYLDVGVGKPEYEYSEEGEEDGEGNFSPDYKKLEKQYLLQGVFPEYFVDALALIPLHVGGTGVIEVLTQRGYTGKVDRLSVTPKWQGDLGVWALTDLIFSTEFVVKTNCCDALETPVTGCLRTSREFVAELLEGSDDYNNFEYTDASDGTTKMPLANNDLVLIELIASGNKVLRKYDESGAEYDPHTVIYATGDAATDLNVLNSGALILDPYFFFASGSGFIQEPTIDTLQEDNTTGRWLVQGKTWKDALVEVKVNLQGGGTQTVAQDTGDNYINTGILFDIPINAVSVFVECFGLSNCTLGVSENEDFNGIGFMGIESTFIVG